MVTTNSMWLAIELMEAPGCTHGRKTTGAHHHIFPYVLPERFLHATLYYATYVFCLLCYGFLRGRGEGVIGAIGVVARNDARMRVGITVSPWDQQHKPHN